MGFIDCLCFNKVILAKQFWQNPDTLIACIMKAKYYAKGQSLTHN